MYHHTLQQARLRDDLRGLIKGDVRCDDVARQIFSTDAGLLQVQPQGVVFPRNQNDVIAVVQYAAEKGIPIHPRGSGTGLTGESLGTGLVLDFSRFMRRIITTSPESVVVQPGIRRRHLNTILGKTRNRFFAPVCGFEPATTIGSILARNGAGRYFLRDGLPSGHLLELKVVSPKGELLTFNRATLPYAMEIADAEMSGIALARGITHGTEHVLADRVCRVLSSTRREAITESASQLNVNRAGYATHGILQGENNRNIDLARILTGSEGTLGLIVEATLKTASVPRRTAAAAFSFHSLENAISTVSLILPFQPVLCELIDRRRLHMMTDWDSRFNHLLPPETEIVLLVELNAGTQDEPIDVQDRLNQLIDLLTVKENRCSASLKIESPNDIELFDEFLHRSELVLYRMRRSIQSLPLFDDLAVPVDSLHPFLLDLLTVLHRRKMTASISGHVGQGHIRVYPIVDLSTPNLPQLLGQLAEDVYSLVLFYRGSISSEWGTGLLKPLFLRAQFPHLMPVFHKIKAVFDPAGLFNPGKVVADEMTHWTAKLRKGLANRGAEHSDSAGEGESPLNSNFIDEPNVPLTAEELQTTPQRNQRRSQLETQLKWEPHFVFESTYRCNGCGECFRNDHRSRMCPMFRTSASQRYSPRAKADLLRGVLEDEIDLAALTHDEAKEVAETCVQCRMCGNECPAEVDVAQLSFRCKSAYTAAHGLPLDDLIFSRLDTVLNLLSMMSCPVNWGLKNRFIRWLLEKFIQIPQGQTIPKIAKITFLNRTRLSRLLHRPPHERRKTDKIALFVDTYANHFDTKLAELAVRILEHNGLSVYIPSRQRPSGLTSFAAGHSYRAEKLARYNSMLFADLLRQGYRVVTLEPSSASCMKKDYPSVVEDEDTETLSKYVTDFCGYLWELYGNERLKLDFKPLPFCAGYHVPCRSMSMLSCRIGEPIPAEKLLRLIPALNVCRIERGCCGMAGMFGFKKKNYRRSLQIGTPLFQALRQTEIDFGVSDCNSCCLQMSHGSNKPAIHPIRLLAAAYGLTTETLFGN
ncbi:oxidase [Planctomycetales bacterium]|nr:oxidase [Planctomycetales bacterium]